MQQHYIIHFKQLDLQRIASNSLLAAETVESDQGCSAPKIFEKLNQTKCVWFMSTV